MTNHRNKINLRNGTRNSTENLRVFKFSPKGLCVFLSLLPVLLLCSVPSYGSFANYNSLLIGERAAGMGGAFTALTEDPAACSFYNPAALSQMVGSSLSASVTLYNKYDTHFGELDDNSISQASQASLRANQGFFVPIPSSSGSVYSLGNFAIGLSIVFPDFDFFSGEVTNRDLETSFLNLRDESLWIGGTIAVNVTDSTSVGLTMYYTSRSYQRSLTDHFTNPVDGSETVLSENKAYTNNSIIYIFGIYHKWTSNWKTGLSLRLPSLEVSGKGTYVLSQVSNGGALPAKSVQLGHIASETRVPMKTALGIAYEREKQWTLSLDFSYYDSDEYLDMESTVSGEKITHLETWNVNLGGEYYLKPWLALRMGVFTNFSSSPEISSEVSERQNDHVDMYGWSANLGFQTSRNSKMTLGGYYTGGSGKSTQQISGQIERVDKSAQTFSFLVSTSFKF